MNKLFLDTNILADIIFDRVNKIKILEILSQKQPFQFYSSPLNLATVCYFGPKFYNLSELQILEDVKKLQINWLDNKEKDISLAKEIWQESDFEDALLIACFNRNILNYFLTTDKKLYKKYKPDFSILLI